jgi:ubiquitin-like 1-activating enzyme E1 B
MCLAADVPLIESGTTGFNGQVQVIKKGRTACYDCTEKEVPKTYPVCTIRSTPSQPIHCIVWAKSYLLPELFGVSEEEETADQFDTTEDADNAEEIKNLKAEAQALKKIRESMGSDDFAKQLFDKVFKEDIERLAGMEDMWKTRSLPQPLDYTALESSSAATTSDLITISLSDQTPWTLHASFTIFKSTLLTLTKRLRSLKATATSAAQSTNPSSIQPIITFDKDDPDTLDFVTAASNLRSHIFSIPTQSKFTVKQIAGNIIPAIATTNATTAGLCVMQAFKVLRGEYGRAKMLFLEQSGARALNSEPPRLPNPECAVCSVANASVEVDPDRATLGDLVAGVLKSELGYGEEITIMNEIGPIYDPDMEDMLDKKFQELGIGDQSFLTVIDDEEDGLDGKMPRVNLQLVISTIAQVPEGRRPVLLATEKVDIPRKQRKPLPEEIRESNGVRVGVKNGAARVKRSAEEAGLDDSDALKRKAAAEVDDASRVGKKDKTNAATAGNGHELIVLDDPGDGSIVIDDD